MGITVQQWRARCGLFSCRLANRGWTATSRGGYESRRDEERRKKAEARARNEFEKDKLSLWILFTILVSIIDMGELLSVILVVSQLSAIIIRQMATGKLRGLVTCLCFVFAINLLNTTQMSGNNSQNWISYNLPTGSTQCTSEEMPSEVWFYSGEVIAEQVAKLLLLMGGVESNPGPVTLNEATPIPGDLTKETQPFSTEEISSSQEVDPSYSPDNESSHSRSDSSSQEPDDEATVHLKSPKAIVMMTCLLQLFSVCRSPECGATIDPANVKVVGHGAAIVVTYCCNNHHSGTWASSPTVGVGKRKVWVLNAVLATFSLTCGMHISQILEYFSHLRIYMFGQTFFYMLQRSLLEKVVWLTWSDCQKSEVKQMKSRHEDGQLIKLAGDGKFDSRGFSAAYCTYNLMDLHSSKVVGLWVAEKHMVPSSTDMEPYAAKTLLLSMAWDHKIPIDSVTTDRSTSMKTMLENLATDLPPDYVPPKHFFDIWHWIKAVLKDLWSAAKLVSCRGLSDWVSSINNMMWHSFSSCQGDPDLLKEKLMSIPGHVSNQHDFPSNMKYKSCPHPPLEGDRAKAWLAPDSLAVKKIRTALTGFDGGRMNDVPHMTGFTHTGLIENWNSLHNKYANKNYYYSHSGMLTRGALAAIDHNYNCNRKQASNMEGIPQFNLVKNRFGNKWHARKILETKDGTWREEIAYLVLLLLEKGRVPKIELPVVSEDFTVRKSVPKPNKADAVKHQQTRMALS